MSFFPNYTDYDTTKKRLEFAKAEDIAKKMEKLLAYGRKILNKSRQSIKDQTDKYRFNIKFATGDWI